MFSGIEKLLYVDEALLGNLAYTSNENEMTVDNVCTDYQKQCMKKTEWGESETRLLLDLYHQYLSEVGPLKKFRNKKNMWENISNEIQLKTKQIRTAAQCQTRYKTILKRKISSASTNKTSGSVRENVMFESEINKIKSLDDSLEPELLMSANNLNVLKPSQTPKTERNKPSKENSILKCLKEIHQEKEANKERRHQEKLKLIRELFQSEKV